MNIGDLLGLDDGSELLGLARQRWGKWTNEHPALNVVDAFDDVQSWLVGADREAADTVLWSLAMLASPDGGDDVAAAGALAKCLLPGACAEAGRLSEMVARGQVPRARATSGQINELVASQLWIEVRTFAWRRLKKVAANILVNTRIGVLRELGDNTQMWRKDRVWANTVLLDDLATGGNDAHTKAPVMDPAVISGTRPSRTHECDLLGDPAEVIDHETPLEELLDLLAWACERDVITDDDRSLLLCLIQEAAAVETRRTGRGCGGLIGNELSTRVAPKIGISGATVRRRASKSIRALAAAAPSRFAGHD